jgi:hypothetical protein
VKRRARPTTAGQLDRPGKTSGTPESNERSQVLASGSPTPGAPKTERYSENRPNSDAGTFGVTKQNGHVEPAVAKKLNQIAAQAFEQLQTNAEMIQRQPFDKWHGQNRSDAGRQTHRYLADRAPSFGDDINLHFLHLSEHIRPWR